MVSAAPPAVRRPLSTTTPIVVVKAACFSNVPAVRFRICASVFKPAPKVIVCATVGTKFRALRVKPEEMVMVVAARR